MDAVMETFGFGQEILSKNSPQFTVIIKVERKTTWCFAEMLKMTYVYNFLVNNLVVTMVTDVCE